MLNFMIILLTLNFMMTPHPLSMVIIIMLSTLLIILISGIILQSFWVSYLFFLIYLGAMLILFVYVTSLAPNEMFSNNKQPSLIFLASILTLSLTPMSSIFLPLDITKNFNKMFSFSMCWTLILLILFLLFSMISVVFISKFHYGPLRMKM